MPSPRALTGDISVANDEHFIQLRNNSLQRLAISKPFYGHACGRTPSLCSPCATGSPAANLVVLLPALSP